MSEAAKGKKKPPRTESHRRSISLARKGKRFSEEHRQALRTSHKGITRTQEAREKQSKTLRERLPEQVARISERVSYVARTRQRSPQELENKMIADPRRIRVRCVTTGRVYESFNHAGRAMGKENGAKIAKKLKETGRGLIYGYEWQVEAGEVSGQT